MDPIEPVVKAPTVTESVVVAADPIGGEAAEPIVCVFQNLFVLRMLFSFFSS